MALQRRYRSRVVSEYHLEGVTGEKSFASGHKLGLAARKLREDAARRACDRPLINLRHTCSQSLTCP